ncbi:MAG TPA: Calx-beta domain-containing protein, partial [Pirellulaceae bacterium]|nr:Calx-beta domain-containing protein [Pirellulaceae bacterium]
AVFTVTLTGTIESDVSVDFATVAGTASADEDYTPAAGTLTFIPGGPSTQQIHVPIVNDSLSEATEKFTVQLTNSSADTLITKSVGSGTILDDDVSLSIGDAGAREGTPKGKKGGSTQYTSLTFNVVLSAPASAEVRVHYATQNGTAAAGSDFVATGGDLVFSKGEISMPITVNVLMDSDAEKDEQFQVVLSAPVGASISDGVGDGTIVDDDTKTRGKPPKGGQIAKEFELDALVPELDVFAFGPAAADHHEQSIAAAASGSGDLVSNSLAAGLLVGDFACHSDLTVKPLAIASAATSLDAPPHYLQRLVETNKRELASENSEVNKTSRTRATVSDEEWLELLAQDLVSRWSGQPDDQTG